jgi:hypothetical protein
VSDPEIEAAYRAQRWIVPVTLSAGGGIRRVMLRGATAVEQLPTCAPVTVNPGARPYYLVRYDEPRYRELAAAAGSMDQRARELLFTDATRLHAAGELADVPYVRLLAAAAEPMDGAVWEALAREYARLDDLIRGAPEASALYAMEVRSLAPYAERARTAAQPAAFRPANAAAAALAHVGDPAVGAAFKTDFLLEEAGSPSVPNNRMGWSSAALAAAAATSDDVDRVEASLRAHANAQAMATFTLARVNEIAFLENVGDEGLARRVLADAMADRTLTQGAPISFLIALGSRHPELAYEYLRTHLDALVKPLPPATQAAVLTDGVAMILWPAAPPAEFERFLTAALPADPDTVRRAVSIIEQRWKERLALRAALRELQGSPVASGCAARVSC